MIVSLSTHADVASVAAVPALVATSPVTTHGRPSFADVVGEAAATVDTLPASPPAEVLDAMRTASGAQNRLAAAGQTLQFDIDPSSGRLSITLAELDGGALRAVSPSTVLHVAAGGSID